MATTVAIITLTLTNRPNLASKKQTADTYSPTEQIAAVPSNEENDSGDTHIAIPTHDSKTKASC